MVTPCNWNNGYVYSGIKAHHPQEERGTPIGWQVSGIWLAVGRQLKCLWLGSKNWDDCILSVSTAKILQLSRLSTWFMIPCLEVRLLNTSLQEKIWTYFQTPNMNTHGWLNDGSHLWQCLNDFSMCRTIRTSLLLLCLMPLVVPGLFLVKYFFLRWNNLTLFVRLSLKVWQMLDVKIPSTSGVS